MLYLFCSFALIFGVAASAQDTFSGQFEKLVNLREGEVAEVSAGLPAASKLPPNARIEVEWAGKWRDDSPLWTEEITVRLRSYLH